MKADFDILFDQTTIVALSYILRIAAKDESIRVEGKEISDAVRAALISEGVDPDANFGVFCREHPGAKTISESVGKKVKRWLT